MKRDKVPALHWMYGVLIASMVVVALSIGWASGRIGDTDASPTPTPSATSEPPATSP